MRVIFALTAAALALGACASTGARESYGQRLAALEADCHSRGGMLEQLRLETRDPGADFACRLQQATRIN